MGFSMLAIRTPDEEDGRLYPLPGEEQGSVRMEQWDGEPLRLTGSAITVQELDSGRWRTLLRARDIKLDLLITDSRFIVSSSKFDKGGGWVGFGGGAFFALAANGVSKARAAYRRRGKLLVGQVRYPWLRCVGYKPKAGWGSSEQIRLGVVARSGDGERQELFLDVALPRNVDSAAVARAIVARAAAYRLAYTDVHDEDRARFEELADGPTLPPPEPKKFALYNLPRHYFVSSAVAYPDRESALAGGGLA
ncbi:MAG: hypothetical protein ACHQHO_11730 [Solirubrobacterales bacterium]